jgi:ATP-dependent RNA helicase DeaD
MPFPATNPALERALAARGYAEPTPVQAAVLQPEAEGRDLLVSAQTGSGKTVAYGLAFADTLLKGAERMPQPGAPLALIIAPTRELAMQVHRELDWLYAETGARIVSCIGGMDPRAEARGLTAGCHIVVGTPGRLCDHLQRGRLSLETLAVIVLDEADEMLDLGFREELEMLLGATPASRRTLLFSATIAREIAGLAKQFQHNALRIDTVDSSRPHADIEYRAVRVAPLDEELAIVNVLRYFEAPTAMVFCATREQVRHLHASLAERGFTSVALSGELTQNERTRALQAMRDGQARVCVATDVAARGIDLPDLGLVIHAALPTNSDTLLHRSGRTGRAGRKGTCVIMVPSNRYRRAEQLLRGAGVDAAWSGPPSADKVRERDGERMLQDPMLTAEATPEDTALATKLLEGRTAEDLAAALARFYRARLPAPEEVADPIQTQRSPQKPERRDREPDRFREPGSRFERNEQRGPSVWFSMNVGRRQRADPKWLVPLICRQGNVTKQDIGNIRIFDTETKFEISASIAEYFTASLPKSGDDVRIVPAGSASAHAPARKMRKDKAKGPKFEGPNKGKRRKAG